jgi:RNA polymerase sigma-70 factor (ECF subfamily)
MHASAGPSPERGGKATSAQFDEPNYDHLVEEAIRGSDTAFTLLWRHFQPRMVRYLATFTNEPEDLSSEVWIKIAHSIKGFEGNAAAFKSWIYTIARNSAVDLARKKSRAGTTVELSDSDWIGENSSIVEIMDLIRRLPQEYSEIVLLRIVADLEVNAVAEIVGKTPGNVRVLTHRGLKQLNEMLQKAGDER